MHSSMMIRHRDFQAKNIRYDPGFAVAEDYDLLPATLAGGLKIRNIGEVVVFVPAAQRQHFDHKNK